MQNKLTNANDFLKYSLIISSIGLLAVFLIILVSSKFVFKPIKESYEKQKRFITDASHELKTPLTIISANNELIEMQSGENEFTSNINKQIKKMNLMVKNLTTLSRMGEYAKMDMVDVNITDTINENYDQFINVLNNDKHHSSITVIENAHVRGNQPLLGQLFASLFENASKYMTNECYISLTENKNDYIFLIKNDALNIPNGNLDQYLERFSRGSANTNIQGVGIGLAMAKEIVELHKGKISAYGSDGYFNIKIIFAKTH